MAVSESTNMTGQGEWFEEYWRMAVSAGTAMPRMEIL